MDLEFKVIDRHIDRVDSGHNIPSGGINDVRCKFIFEPGYNWDSIPNKTAIFARETKWAFQININDDEFFYVPASILARQGTVYVSIIGSTSDGIKVVQTGTIAVLVEPNGLNRNTAVIFPINQHNEYDTDAYAQYVAAVNSAANRAEEAARKLEEVVNPGYTKEEADAKFQEKIFISKPVNNTDMLPLDTVLNNTSPSLRIPGLFPKVGATDSRDNPGGLYGVSAFIIDYLNNDESVFHKEITGFNQLYKLSYLTTDYIDILPNKIVLHRNTQTLDLINTIHEWLDPVTLRIDISNENKIKVSDAISIFTNIGNVVQFADSHYIYLSVPEGYDLTDYKIVYPLETEQEFVLELEGLGPVVDNKYMLTVKAQYGVNDLIFMPYYVITYAINPVSFINKVFDKVSAKLTDLDNRVKELEGRVN